MMTLLERAMQRIRLFMAETMGLGSLDSSARVDAGLMIAAGALSAIFGLWLFYQLDFDVMCRSVDTWLDSDPARAIAGLHSRHDMVHDRSNIHPLWGIGVATFFMTAHGLGLVNLETMSASYVALSAFAFAVAFLTALRLLRFSRIDSLLVYALFMSTSGAWLWFGIPELYILGGVSLLIPLIWLSLPRGQHDQWTGPLQSLISLSITITNWAGGLLAALLALGVRRAMQTALIAFAAAGILAVLQYRFFLESGGFFNIWTERWADYGTTGTFLDHTRAFFITTIAAPMPDLLQIDSTYRMELGDRLSRLQFAPVTNSPSGIVALLLWTALIIRGLTEVRSGLIDPKAAVFVIGMVAFNFVLHAFYGVETFLYALHYLPFMVIIAGWSLLRDKGRLFIRAIAVAAIIAGTFHNYPLFVDLSAWYNMLPPESVVADPTVLIPACT